MSDAYSEAISTDDSPAPPASRARMPLLGDPHTEGNEQLVADPELGPDAPPPGPETDDLHAELGNSDVQN